MEEYLLPDLRAEGAGREVSDGVPRDPAFEEFASQKKPLSVLLSEAPSLNYLFSPFDPGKIEEAVFAPLEGEAPPREFPFEDLDLRDSAIVNTLDRAEKKALQIVGEARDERERVLGLVEGEAEDLKKRLALEAESQAEKIVSDAKSEAARIVAEAEREAGDLAALRRQTEDLKAEAAAVLEDVNSGREKNREREEELIKSEAQFKERTEIWEREKEREAGELRKKSSEDGYREGLNKGREEGRKKGEAEIRARLDGLLVVLDKLQNLYDDLWRQNAPQMVDLAIEAAEAIVNKEVENAKGLAAGAFAQAVLYLKNAHKAEFRVRPEDVAELEAARAALRGRVDGLSNVTFVPDPALGPGDVIMESDIGRLDATLKTRRDKVMETLRQAFREGVLGTMPPPPDYPAFASAPREPAEESESAPDPAASWESPAPESAPDGKAAWESAPEAMVEAAPEAAAAEIPKTAAAADPPAGAGAAEPSAEDPPPRSAAKGGAEDDFSEKDAGKSPSEEGSPLSVPEEESAEREGASPAPPPEEGVLEETSPPAPELDDAPADMKEAAPEIEGVIDEKAGNAAPDASFSPNGAEAPETPNPSVPGEEVEFENPVPLSDFARALEEKSGSAEAQGGASSPDPGPPADLGGAAADALAAAPEE
jgi:flagellar assembly protein FliH